MLTILVVAITGYETQQTIMQLLNIDFDSSQDPFTRNTRTGRRGGRSGRRNSRFGGILFNIFDGFDNVIVTWSGGKRYQITVSRNDEDMSNLAG
jgi:hypothetical protein